MDGDVPHVERDGSERKRSKKKKVITITVMLALALIVLGLFVNLNGNSINFMNRDLRVIITDSMDGGPTDYPISTIPKDSLVMVRLISEDEKYDLQPGDVVQFRYHGILNHHRVVSNDTVNHKIVTKGDNTTSSETVLYENIRGEVVGVNHFLGVIFELVSSYFYVLLATIVVIYIGILLLEEIRKEKEDEKK